MTATSTPLIQEIEDYLRIAAAREMFTSDEVLNLLLDLRNLAEPDLN